MSAYVDTSALLAILDADDRQHARAAAAWRGLIEAEEELVVTTYVLVETFALVQNRLGLKALRTFQQDVVPMLHIAWMNEEGHDAAVTALLTAARRRLSLVDCASFDTMRRSGLTRAFTLDRHFSEQGFEQIP
jgi:predicted nucleic acid-binding protein